MKDEDVERPQAMIIRQGIQDAHRRQGHAPRDRGRFA